MTDGTLRLQISPGSEHVANRGDSDACLNYLAFWYNDLRKADLVLQPRNRR